jgi:hypothetical protein
MLTTATKLVAQSGSVLSRAGIPSSWTDELNDIHDELIVYMLQFNAAWKER